jgi:hypothetical protein
VVVGLVLPAEAALAAVVGLVLPALVAAAAAEAPLAAAEALDGSNMDDDHDHVAPSNFH